MGKLPRPSAKEMVRFLEQQGYSLVRVRGSHHFLSNGHQHTSVSVHGNRALKIGTLRSILRDINMSPAAFEHLWSS